MIVVEGQFDCVLAHQAGTTETVALSGTALTSKQVSLIARYCDTVILALDGDSAGIGALTRSVKELFAQDMAVKVCVLPDKQDPADVIKKNPEDWLKLVSEAKDYLQVRLELLDRQFETQKEKDKAIREEVYPLVFQIENPLTLDRALQYIAKTLGVQFETILKDYEMTTANFIKNSEQKSTQELSKEDSLEFLHLKYLEYIEKGDNESLKQELSKQFLDNKEKMQMRAELLYKRDNLRKVLERETNEEVKKQNLQEQARILELLDQLTQQL